MTIEDSIKWMESKAEEQEKLGSILDAEDYMQIAEYLRDLKCGLEHNWDMLGDLMRSEEEQDISEKEKSTMTKFIKIDNAYVNTAHIVSVVEETQHIRVDGEWVSPTHVVIRTVDGGTFYFTGSLNDVIELIKEK